MLGWGFFLMGASFFALYVWFTLWIIFDQNRKQREEGNGTQGYYERHQPDDIDPRARRPTGGKLKGFR